MNITNLFKDFTDSEKSSGILLVILTAISLIIANSSLAENYHHFWQTRLFDQPVEYWVNDGLMTIFFLLIGLEMEREIYKGELSTLKKASLPLVGALGGMLIPVTVYIFFNYNSSLDGIGIPMATDIAFALGILSLLGNKIPVSLKIFLTALAVIDDLGAIIVIAIFYSQGFSAIYFSIAMAIFIVLLILNRLKVYNLWVYLIPGFFMWYCMLNSGVHATITGVLLAFAIPFENGSEKSISYKLQKSLHKPVAFIILPIFAMANTGINLSGLNLSSLLSTNSMGIMMGLLIGKPLGILTFLYLALKSNLCCLPEGLKIKQFLGIGFLGGVGFTMSIFITILAFENHDIIDTSKLSILIASILAGIIGYVILRYTKFSQPEV